MRCLRFFNTEEVGSQVPAASFKKVFARVDLKTKRKTSSKPRNYNPPPPSPSPPSPQLHHHHHHLPSTLFSLIYYTWCFLYLN
ncbi:hypothetical protein M0802_007618 [Mischocyttarus mexicanus]|nr:hypothetical protein M0802_007618 [Mischocyttarus mexicanus]